LGVNKFYIAKPLRKGRTINAGYFQKEILTPLSQALKSEKVDPPLWMHTDNASSHKTGISMTLAEKLGFRVMPHPPFSPDFAPSDFYLFGRVKLALKGMQNASAEETTLKFEKVLQDITLQERLNVMMEWITRLLRVVAQGGSMINKRFRIMFLYIVFFSRKWTMGDNERS
jgi:histone-lysine N-methyltransferase SETMAR